MNRWILASLLFLGIAAFSGRLARAQQPTSSPSASDRPIKVIKVSVPFGNYRYRLGWGAQHYFAGFSQMVLNLSDANQPPQRPAAERPPGRVKYESITLERGVAHDTSFAQWANQAQGHQELRDLIVDVFNETGRKREAHQMTGCLVAEYQSLPNLDGGANNIAIEHIQLRCRSVK
jgi:phage tail-like protein